MALMNPTIHTTANIRTNIGNNNGEEEVGEVILPSNSIAAPHHLEVSFERVAGVARSHRQTYVY